VTPLNRVGLSPGNKKLVLIFWLLALVLGSLQTWNDRDWMFDDGISYLEVGEAYLRGDWSAAINGYWSPLYSWVLVGVMALFETPPQGDFAMMHLVDFLIFLCSLACFHFYLIGLIRYQGSKAPAISGDPLPDGIWIVLGYTLFLWSALNLISISVASPDMMVAALVYLASGILIRIQMGAASWPLFAVLGVVLGFGYLAKAAMFPLAFVFLATCLLSRGNFRSALPPTVVALAAFLLIASPFIAALSLHKGRLTFGDSAKLNVAWSGGVTKVFWQGEGVNHGTPKHPPRKLLDSPAIYEFRTPFRVTFPIWYDASYWYEGVKIDLYAQLKNRLGHLASSALKISSFFVVLILGVICFWVANLGFSTFFKGLSESSFLLLPAIAALSMYSMIYMAGRYIGPFVVLLGLGIVSTMLSFESRRLRKLPVYALIALMLAVFGVKTSRNVAHHIYSAFKEMSGEAKPSIHRRLARGLTDLGARPGDDVAFLGNVLEPYGVRLARLHLVAQMPGETPEIEAEYWTASDPQKCRIVKTFSHVGAKFIIAEWAPSYASTLGWKKLGDTNFYVYTLSAVSERCDDRTMIRGRTR
jgi:hypothetical protein